MDNGKKMALLVGCNYPNTPNELHGCHNDVLAMREALVARFGFNPSNIELLTDEPGSSIMPTGSNIKKALHEMVDRAQSGDVLFFHYSGHGTLIKSRIPFKTEEAIVPCDFNLITSMDFQQLVNRVPEGATFTILSDSCHSGGLIEKETEQIGPASNDPNAEPIPPPHKPKLIPFQSLMQHLASLTNITAASDIGSHLLELFGAEASLMFRLPLNELYDTTNLLKVDEGILLSGCQKDETSADVSVLENGMKACGVFSNAVQMVLKENSGNLSNREVVTMARKVLVKQRFYKQHPCLYCSDENADAVFLSTTQKQQRLCNN